MAGSAAARLISCPTRGRAGHPWSTVVAERPQREVIIEFQRIGASLKVTAVDPETLTEVSIVGDPGAGEELLKRTAVRKLDYVLAKRAASRRPAR